jgi:CDP-paratose 2-epimerase
MSNRSNRTPALHVRPADINGHDSRPVLITGGCGFIGTNVADRFLSRGHKVILFDNLSRTGAETNLEWLQETYGDLVQFEPADVRNQGALRKVIKGVSKVFHFAAQVAVTTSLTNPIEDFEVNARGTLNLLEAVRSLTAPPPIVFTSSNKVYGDLADVDISGEGSRYEPVDTELRKHGFNEGRPLDFHSPYGCSKGAAGQYVLDYARTFKIPAVVFHMSCIYGLHQFGNEDQGWVAHFLIRALKNEPISIYGDGKQVRDILFIDDLVDAFLLAHGNMDRLSGQSFNIGGGPQNTISLLELLDLIQALRQERPDIQFQDWRSADQQYYVSDIRRFSAATGWSPKVSARQGIERLYHWLKDSRLEEISSRARSGLNVDASRKDPMQVSEAEPRSKRLWREKQLTGKGVSHPS